MNREIDEEEMERIAVRHARARECVKALCANNKKWVMSIPAQPEVDPDLLISDSLRDVPLLIEELKRSRQRFKEMAKMLDQADRHIEVLKAER